MILVSTTRKAPRLAPTSPGRWHRCLAGESAGGHRGSRRTESVLRWPTGQSCWARHASIWPLRSGSGRRHRCFAPSPQAPARPLGRLPLACPSSPCPHLRRHCRAPLPLARPRTTVFSTSVRRKNGRRQGIARLSAAFFCLDAWRAGRSAVGPPAVRCHPANISDSASPHNAPVHGDVRRPTGDVGQR